MDGSEATRETRRSSRVALSIPVKVSGKDSSGAEFSEKAATYLVSKHGAMVLLRHRLTAGADVGLSVPHLERQQRCRVAWVCEKAEENGKYQTGLELVGAENFWGIQFPPGDWVIPKQAPLAGDHSGSFSLQSYLGNNEPQVLFNMLSALVSLLEKKGVVSRAELSDMLKRLNE